MSDESSAAILNTETVRQHLASYLNSGGKEGHILDLTEICGRPFVTNCLLRHVGRKSGKVYIVPLIYGVFGGEIVLVASKAGADHHPAWYLNIKASDEVRIQVASQAFSATWREVQGTEYERIWDFMAGLYPSFDDYKQSTGRKIPIVLLQVTGNIPVFSASEL